MENHHKFLKEHRHNIRKGQMTLVPAPTIKTFQVANPMGRQNL
jgi:hypothetical protein